MSGISTTNRATSLQLLFGARRMQTVCACLAAGTHKESSAACRQRLPPPSSLRCTEEPRSGITTPNQATNLQLLFGARRMQTVRACLAAGTHKESSADCRQRLPPPSSLRCTEERISGITTTNRATSLQLLFGARRMETVCACLAAGTHKRCLPTKAAAAFLFALHGGAEVRTLHDQSSKLLAAALRCEADVDCACLAVGTHKRCLPTKAAAACLFALHGGADARDLHDQSSN